VIAFLAAVAVQAAQPTFAFGCKMEGTLAPKGVFNPFKEPRKFALLVRRDDGSLSPLRTFDPSGLLAGREIKMFRSANNNGTPTYGGITSLPSADHGAMIASFTPSNSTKFNEWKLAIGGAEDKVDGDTFTVGRCLLIDGASEADFNAMIANLGDLK
jgi:hypothetical protein